MPANPAIEVNSVLAETGRRLKAARIALDATQSEMANFLGRAPTAISAWGIGRNEIGAVALGRLTARFGIPADWILSGALDGMPYELAAKIMEVMRKEPATGHTRRGRPLKRKA